MLKKFAKSVAPILALVGALPASASADVSVALANGDFNYNATTDGGYNGQPSQILTSSTSNPANYTKLAGWTVTSGTYGFLMAPGTLDTTGGYSPQFNNTFTMWGSNNGGTTVIPATSPTGGNFLALDGADGYRGGGIEQVINGLTIGQNYALSFYWASGQQHGFDGATQEAFQVKFGNQTQYTSVANNVSHGFTNWSKQTMVFTASSTSQTLNFLALGTPGGLPPMVLLDGVSMAAVPEPASLALTGVGLLVAGGVHQVRRRTVTPA